MSAVGAGGRSQHRQPGPAVHPPQAARRARRSSADEVAQSLTRKLAAVPGMRVFITNPPVINIGGRSSKSLYQFTLQGSDIGGALRRRRDAGAAAARRAGADRRHQRPADQEPAGPGRRSTATGPPRSASTSTRSRARSTTPTARARSAPSTRRTTSTGWSWSCCPQYQRDLSAMSLLHITGRAGRVGAARESGPGDRRPTGPLTVNHSGQLPVGHARRSTSSRAPRSARRSTRVQAAAREVLPSTISTSFSGTAAAFQQAQQGLLVLLVLAILVIYLVLGILYESFVHPLTILSGLPVRRVRRAAGAGDLPAGPQHLRLRRHHHADRHREEERDHDDRFRDRGGAERTGRAPGSRSSRRRACGSGRS